MISKKVTGTEKKADRCDCDCRGLDCGYVDCYVDCHVLRGCCTGCDRTTCCVLEAGVCCACAVAPGVWSEAADAPGV